MPNSLPGTGAGEEKKNNACPHGVGTFRCGEKTEVPKAVIPGWILPGRQLGLRELGEGEVSCSRMLVMEG